MKQIDKISYLIKEYQNNNYTTDAFCDEFVSTLYYEKDDSIPLELFELLDKYATIFSRFSPFDEDIKFGILFDEARIRNEFKQLIDELSKL